MKRAWRIAGFTLVELITVLIVVGVIASVAAGMVGQSLQAFLVGSETADNAAQAQLTLEKLARDLRTVRSATSTDLTPAASQISFAEQGGSDTPVPDLSIEVDDVDAAFDGMQQAGFAIEYGPTDEPWGVRRFYVRDPFGKLVNLLAHLG